MRLSLFIVLTFGATHLAADEIRCFNNYTFYNICDDARLLAEREAERLPLRISEHVEIVSFSADGNVLTERVRLLYDRTHLELALIEEGGSLEHLKRKMFQNVRDIACDVDTTKAFLALGGHLHYEYEFEDGTPFFDFYVSVC